VSRAAEAYLEAHGVGVEPHELDAELAAAMERRAAMLRGPSSVELGRDEAEVWRSVGFVVDGGSSGAFARTLADFAALIKASLSVEAAAAELGVNASRVRQRLAERSLYGFQAGGRWRLPGFQLDQGRILPHFREVLAALDPALHPLEVEHFFLIPDPDLETAGIEAPLAPRDWLRLGLPSEPVIRLAEEC
jgi:hypothetical protein